MTAQLIVDPVTISSVCDTCCTKIQLGFVLRIAIEKSERERGSVNKTRTFTLSFCYWKRLALPRSLRVGSSRLSGGNTAHYDTAEKNLSFFTPHPAALKPHPVTKWRHGSLNAASSPQLLLRPFVLAPSRARNWKVGWRDPMWNSLNMTTSPKVVGRNKRLKESQRDLCNPSIGYLWSPVTRSLGTKWFKVTLNPN